MNRYPQYPPQSQAHSFLKTRTLDSVIHACMNACMKTITLDEDAYRRLLAWKRTKGDSFSKVIKRVVPEAGTIGAMVQFVSNRRVSEEQDSVLEAAVDERSSSKHDPWT